MSLGKTAAFCVMASACAGGGQPASPPPAERLPAHHGSLDPQPATIVDVDPAVEPEPPEPALPEIGEVSPDRGWATFHAGAARTGAIDAPVINRPKIRWKAKVGIQGYLNGPLAVGNLAILPSSGARHNLPDPQDGVVALDLATGRRVWHAPMLGDANGALAIEDRVVATSDDGHVRALDIRTGKERWKQKGEGKMYSHPLGLGDRVIVGDELGYVRAFALSDGKPLWQVQLSGAIRGGASSDGKQIYAVSQGGDAIALRPDGKPVWRVTVDRPPWEGRGKNQPVEAYSPPVVSGDSLFVPFSRDTYYSDQPGVLALDKRTGRVRWRAKGPGDWGNVRTTPVLVGGLLIWGEPYSGDVAAVHANTGRMAYRATIGPCYFPQWASPAAAGDVVYLPRFDGSLYALRAASGKVLWQIYLGEAARAGSARPASPPDRCEWQVPSGDSLYAPIAIAEDGTLLVGSGEGYLYALTNH
jgi:eukaryotic-like serine/threonine-protein kinase